MSHSEIVKDVFLADKFSLPYQCHLSRQDKPLLIFFPGLMMRLESWGFIQNNEAFNRDFNLLFFEHHGQFNASSYSDAGEKYRVEDNRILLEGILEKLGLADCKYHLIGISSGCAYMYDFAVKQPEHVLSAAFISPVCYFDRNSYREHRAREKIGLVLDEDMWSEYLDLFYFDFYSDFFPESSLNILRQSTNEQFAAKKYMLKSLAKIYGAILDYETELRKSLKVFAETPFKKLVLAGEKDRSISPLTTRQFAATIGADFELRKSLSHVFFVEEPGHFVKLLEKFIRDAGQSDGRKSERSRNTLHIPATFNLNNRLIYDVVITDWSPDGCLLQMDFLESNFVDWSSSIGQPAEIEVGVPVKKKFAVQIVWTKKHAIYRNIGVKFTQVQQEDAE